jgi:CubicO group peptidase (beta-lactamase class C family)
MHWDFNALGTIFQKFSRWKDRQIVSEKWVAESTTSYSETDISERGYGYLWWVNVRQKSYSANGYKGQVMIVNPVRDLIIVHQVDTENDPNKSVSGGQFSELLQRIINANLTEG